MFHRDKFFRADNFVAASLQPFENVVAIFYFAVFDSLENVGVELCFAGGHARRQSRKNNGGTSVVGVFWRKITAFGVCKLLPGFHPFAIHRVVIRLKPISRWEVDVGNYDMQAGAMAGFFVEDGNEHKRRRVETRKKRSQKAGEVAGGFRRRDFLFVGQHARSEKVFEIKALDEGSDLVRVSGENRGLARIVRFVSAEDVVEAAVPLFEKLKQHFRPPFP